MKPVMQLVSKHVALRLALTFGLFMACLIGFMALADEVIEGDTLLYDEAALQAIYAQSSVFWDQFYLVATQLGGTFAVIILTTVLLALLVINKQYRRALIVFAGVGGAALMNVILKLIFERTRPELWDQLILETSFSFPSGHAMISAALAFSVIAICYKTRFRWIAIYLGSAYVILIGFSRLYLGVHYPTDILAGWLVSGAWLVVVTWMVKARDLQRFLKHQDS